MKELIRATLDRYGFEWVSYKTDLKPDGEISITLLYKKRSSPKHYIWTESYYSREFFKQDLLPKKLEVILKNTK